jgi:hypothetical protein
MLKLSFPAVSGGIAGFGVAGSALAELHKMCCPLSAWKVEIAFKGWYNHQQQSCLEGQSRRWKTYILRSKANRMVAMKVIFVTSSVYVSLKYARPDDILYSIVQQNSESNCSETLCIND